MRIHVERDMMQSTIFDPKKATVAKNVLNRTLVEIYHRYEGTRGFAARMTITVVHGSPPKKDCWQQLLPAVLT